MLLRARRQFVHLYFTPLRTPPGFCRIESQIRVPQKQSTCIRSHAFIPATMAAVRLDRAVTSTSKSMASQAVSTDGSSVSAGNPAFDCCFGFTNRARAAPRRSASLPERPLAMLRHPICDRHQANPRYRCSELQGDGTTCCPGSYYPDADRPSGRFTLSQSFIYACSYLPPLHKWRCSILTSRSIS